MLILLKYGVLPQFLPIARHLSNPSKIDTLVHKAPSTVPLPWGLQVFERSLETSLTSPSSFLEKFRPILKPKTLFTHQFESKYSMTFAELTLWLFSDLNWHKMEINEVCHSYEYCFIVIVHIYLDANDETQSLLGSEDTRRARRGTRFPKSLYFPLCLLSIRLWT